VPNDIEQDIYLGTGGGLFRSPIGGTSFAACGTSFAARALGYDFGEEILLCQKTKNDGKLYTVTGHPTTPVATAIGYLGGLVGDMVTFYDQDGALVPYISVFKAPSTDNAGKPLASLYRVDLLEEKVYPVSDAPPAVVAPASGQTYKNIIVWNSWLYMALEDHLYRYQPGKWERVPPSAKSFNAQFHNSDSGQPFTITGMAVTAGWLYLFCKSTVSGADASMIAVGPNGDWHALARQTNPKGTDLGYSDDWSPPRIYLWGYTAGTAEMSYIEIPTVGGRPSTTPTYKYETGGGWFILPIFDGRYTEIEGTALAITVVGERLSADEYVTIKYGLNGTFPATILGEINNTVSSLSFGSGVGVAFKTIQFLVELTSPDTTTKTPIIRRIVFTYLKKPPVRYRYTAAIEVKATRTALRSIETLLAEFETVYNATTLQQLKYGRVSTYINLVAVNFIERPPATKTGQRNVYQIQLVMEEPI
jgi:hypothetical protein